MEQHTFTSPVVVPTFCPYCGQVHNVTVEHADLLRWNARQGHIQDIFPYLSPAERELILSGICDSCWDKLFSPPSTK